MRAERLLAVAALAGALGLAVGAPPVRASSPPGATQVAALLHGIPQHGVALGAASAPVTLVEFADLQCPYCARWERSALPEIIRKYVRPGKVRIVFVGMTFIGPDSAKAFRAALAAGQQNHFWDVVELLYLNQGEENSGWVKDALLRSLGRTVQGLNVAKMLAARSSVGVKEQLAAASSIAASAGIQQTPSFAVGLTNKPPKLVKVMSLDAGGIEPALDALLTG
jgi:protein-disulfide isomerase